MKGKDLFMIGGLGLALYLLVPKAKEAAATGGITILPTATPTTPGLDIGGIFGGMAEMFSGILGAMPAQIVPEINIPEFKLPDIIIPEIDIPDLPEQIIPALPDELLPDIASLIPDVTGLIPGLTGEGETVGALAATIDTAIREWDRYWGYTAKGIEAIPKLLTGEPFIPGWTTWPWGEPHGDMLTERTLQITETGEPYVAETEDIPIAEVSEYAESIEVPPNFLTMTVEEREAFFGRDEVDIAAKYPEYEADIALLKKHPYFSQFYE